VTNGVCATNSVIDTHGEYLKETVADGVAADSDTFFIFVLHVRRNLPTPSHYFVEV
jgi:hypothetical protein